jgi:hypothetical protein
MIDSKDILRNTNPPSVVFTRDMITDSNWLTIQIQNSSGRSYFFLSLNQTDLLTTSIMIHIYSSLNVHTKCVQLDIQNMNIMVTRSERSDKILHFLSRT